MQNLASMLLTEHSVEYQLFVILTAAILHGVQLRMISEVNFFIFLRLFFFALLLLYVT